MKKSYLKRPIYTLVFILIDIAVTAGLIWLAFYSLNQNGEYRFDFTWMIIFFITFFFALFNAHFVYIGAFTRVVTEKDSLKIKRAIKTDTLIKWLNVTDIRIAKELSHYIKTVDAKIIVVEGYDEITKSDVCLQIDYGKKMYDAIIDCANNVDSKTLKKMEKYFN